MNRITKASTTIFQSSRYLTKCASNQRTVRLSSFTNRTNAGASTKTIFQEFSNSSKYLALGALTLTGTALCFLTNEQEEAIAQEKKPKIEERHVPKELLDQLQKMLGARCHLDMPTRDTYGKDQSFHPSEAPDIVVFPISTQEVSDIVKACAKYKVPIVPFGSGTSLEGHISATSGGVCIAFTEMQKVIVFHKNDLDVKVQPGITYGDLNDFLNPHGLFFPMDPGPGASIGGMIGTSCSGTNAVKYGTMKDNVLSLTVVLPNGEIVKTGNRARKSSAGYDLTHMFIGSEGTLGVVTEINLKLKVIPPARNIGVIQFDRIENAAALVMDAMSKGVAIGKVELLDEVAMKAVTMYNPQINMKLKPSLFFEFSGTEAAVAEAESVIAEMAQQYRGGPYISAKDKEERDNLWLGRKTALWAAPILKDGSQVKITDVCVPLSNFAKCISETKEDLKKSFLQAPLVGHAGDGNFHLFILVDPENENDLKEMNRLDHRLTERAISMEGTCTGEHGVGYGKKKYLIPELGVEAVDLMRTIKKAIDPDNIMNPGKVIPDKNDKY